MITLEQIRERLAECIKQSGMTQTELAQKMGIKQPTIGQYLSGRAMPTLDTLANLCRILDANANYILCQDTVKGGTNKTVPALFFRSKLIKH